MIKEYQILAEALWESVKADLNFFSPIKSFSMRLAEIDFTDTNELKDSVLYVEKIEDFFSRYRSRPGGAIYIPPAQASKNQDLIRRLFKLAQEIKHISTEQLNSVTAEVKPISRKVSKGGGKVFIGHGRSKLWARVDLFLKEELGIETLTFESESRTSETIVSILEELLEASSYAILIFTAEDETKEGKSRARQNVVHEAGLFQGRLGFDKVIILKQAETEDFSNLAGLQYIGFAGDEIEQCFYELGRKLKKSGLLK